MYISDGVSRYYEDIEDYKSLCELFGVERRGYNGMAYGHYRELQKKAQKLREAKRKIMAED